VRPADVTIVVLAWNRCDETLACLASLRRADLRGARVLVVDNGSTDGTADAVRAAHPEASLLALPENRGYAGGNNAGIRAALDDGAAAVLLLNNDTEVAPDFLPPLLDALASGPEIGVVSSAILRMDRPELLDVAWSEVQFGRRHVVQLVGTNALPGHGFDRRCEIQVAAGCSVLIRADVLRAVGLFDEAYFAYHEDVDWCLRVRAAGHRIVFEPFSRVFHRRSASTARPRPPGPSPGPRAAGVLPGDEPPPWNPVRTYLGARNVIRLLRAHATARQKCAFLLACVRELPLELLAVVWDREGWMTLGRWDWAAAVRHGVLERHPALHARARGRVARAVVVAALLPWTVLVALPRDLWRAHRAGRLEQFAATVRGLRDGYLRRPIPFARLGLR
jgi:GT2 family glycosyltransferase